jgi:hypothetical protein
MAKQRVKKRDYGRCPAHLKPTIWARAHYQDPGGKRRFLTLYDVALKSKELGAMELPIFADPLNRVGTAEGFDVNKYVALADSSLSGTLFAVDSLPSRALGPDMDMGQLVAKWIKGKAGGPGEARSAVTVVARATSVLKNTSLAKDCSRMKEARSEVLALALMVHVIKIKRLPPWVTMILDYGCAVSPNNFLPYTVDMVTEKADATLYDWLSFQLKKGLEVGSPRLLAFQRRLDGIFAQIVLALHAFQKHAGFVHNYLHLKNVMVQQRKQTGNMRYNTDGVSYVFEEDIPLMKFCDFGHTYVIHPETRRVSPGAFFGCPLGALNNCTDLTRVCIGLAKMRPDRYQGQVRLSEFSTAMAADLDAVLRPLEDNYSRSSNSLEQFAFPIGANFMTPAQLVRRGKTVAQFVSTELATYDNTFHHLVDDGWPYKDSAAEHAFFVRESGSPSPLYTRTAPVLGYKLMNLDFHNPHFGHDISVMVPVVIQALFARMQASEGVMAFGGSDHAMAQHKHVRKRMLWCALILYQRAVLFYMRTFAQVMVTPSGELSDFMQNGSLPVDGGHGISEEFTLEATRIRGMFAPDLAEENMPFRYSLWAACGGFADLFDAFKGLDGYRHFRRGGDGEAATARAVLSMYHSASGGWKIRAPIEYAALEDVHQASEETLTNAFIHSSNVSYYSHTLEEALAVLKVKP